MGPILRERYPKRRSTRELDTTSTWNRDSRSWQAEPICPGGAWLKGIRDNIDKHADELKEIINGETFKRYFGALDGDTLKTAPRGYSMDHPEIELLRLKSYLAVHNLSDKQVLQTDFLDHCTSVFMTLYPFDQFLNKAAKKPA